MSHLLFWKIWWSLTNKAWGNSQEWFYINLVDLQVPFLRPNCGQCSLGTLIGCILTYCSQLGGNTQYKGFKERIVSNLTECRPFGSECNVRVASDPSLDAWNGAKLWAEEHAHEHNLWMTKQDFDENGWEYLLEHEVSNKSYAVAGQGWAGLNVFESSRWWKRVNTEIHKS